MSAANASTATTNGSPQGGLMCFQAAPEETPGPLLS